MMETYKIVIAGEMGAGKTTAIATISDTHAVSTEVKNNDPSHQKKSTTVGMDYGSIAISDSIKLLLFGTPGQKRFEFMWEILSKGSLGTIILIKANSPTIADDLELFINAFHRYGSNNIILGVTYSDEQDARTIDAIQDLVDEHCTIKNLPIFSCDPRNKEEMLYILETLISMIDADLI